MRVYQVERRGGGREEYKSHEKRYQLCIKFNQGAVLLHRAYRDFSIVNVPLNRRGENTLVSLCMDAYTCFAASRLAIESTVCGFRSIRNAPDYKGPGCT